MKILKLVAHDVLKSKLFTVFVWIALTFAMFLTSVGAASLVGATPLDEMYSQKMQSCDVIYLSTTDYELYRKVFEENEIARSNGVSYNLLGESKKIMEAHNADYLYNAYGAVYDANFVKNFSFPLSKGRWFSQPKAGNEIECIVSQSYATFFPIGSKLQVNLRGGYLNPYATYTATVVGIKGINGLSYDYLPQDDTGGNNFVRSLSNIVFSLPEVPIKPFYESADSDSRIEYWGGGIVLEKDALSKYDFSKEGTQLRQFSMRTIYENQKAVTEQLSNVFVIFGILALGLMVSLTLGALMTRQEKEKRILALRYMHGASERELVLCEAIKNLLCIALPTILSAVFYSIFANTRSQFTDVLFLHGYDYLIGWLLVTLLFAGASLSGVLSVTRRNPVESLKREEDA